MRRFLIISSTVVLIVIVAAVLLHSVRAPNDAYQSLRKETVTHNERERTYYVYNPATSTEARLPLVVNYHGGGASAQAHAELTQMNHAADKYGFRVVYPQGLGENRLGKTFGTWNGGNCCGYAKEHSVDDIGFSRAMIDEVKGMYSTEVVYATGFSNGAYMAYRLACEASDTVSAVAPVAGDVGVEMCDPQENVDILTIRMRDDECIPYEGGKRCGGCLGDMQWQCRAAEATADVFRRRYNCSEYATNEEIPNGSIITYQCDDARVDLLSVTRGGHVWPGGSKMRLPERLIGPHAAEPAVNDIMWQFFTSVKDR